MIENNLSVNAIRQISPMKPTERSSETKEKEPVQAPQDRDKYVPSEKDKPIGIYGISHDEDGNPRVSSDSDTVTANTDKVDREIKKLREKEQALIQKLRTADEDTSSELRRELEQVTAELAKKDNDKYRRQNTSFS